MNVMDTVRKMIAPLQRRVMLMLLRGVVQTVKSGKLQRIQLSGLSEEVLDGLELLEPYGFTSVPKAGAEAFAAFMGGNRDHGVVLVIADRRTRPQTLAEGDTALWTSSGAILALKDATKNIEGTIGKLKLENASHELTAVLVEALTETITTVQAIIDARTATLAGPMPLLNPADTFLQRKTALTAVKTKLETFKV